MTAFDSHGVPTVLLGAGFSYRPILQHCSRSGRRNSDRHGLVFRADQESPPTSHPRASRLGSTGRSCSRIRSTFSRTRCELPVSNRRTGVARRPADRSGASVGGTPDAPPRLDDKRRSGLRILADRPTTMGSRQPVSQRYPPSGFEVSADARPLPVTSPTTGLVPFSLRQAFLTWLFLSSDNPYASQVRQRLIRVRIHGGYQSLFWYVY